MTLSLIQPPFGYYPDPNIGRPVFNGSVFIGEPDQDPESTLKEITAIQEDGTAIPITNPYSLGPGGTAVSNGNQVRVLVDGNYSMLVKDSSGATVYFISNRFSSDPVSASETVLVFNTVDAMILSDLSVGQIVKTLGYKSVSDGGGNDYSVVPAATGVSDGFLFIDLTISSLQAQAIESHEYRCLQAGVSLSNTNAENTIALQSIATAASGTTTPMIVERDFVSDGQIVFNGNATVIFRDGSLTCAADINFYVTNETTDAIFTLINPDIRSSVGASGILQNKGVRTLNCSELNLLGISKIKGFFTCIDESNAGASNGGKLLIERIFMSDVFGAASGFGQGIVSTSSSIQAGHISADNSAVLSGNGRHVLRILGLIDNVNISSMFVKNWAGNSIVIDPSIVSDGVVNINDVHVLDSNTIPVTNSRGIIVLGETSGVVPNLTVNIDGVNVDGYEGFIIRSPFGGFANSSFRNITGVNLGGTVGLEFSAIDLVNSVNNRVENVYVSALPNSTSNVVKISGTTTSPTIIGISSDSTLGDNVVSITGATDYTVKDINNTDGTLTRLSVSGSTGIGDVGYNQEYVDYTVPAEFPLDVTRLSKIKISTTAISDIDNVNQFEGLEEGQVILISASSTVPVNNLRILNSATINNFIVQQAGFPVDTVIINAFQSATYIFTGGVLNQISGKTGTLT